MHYRKISYILITSLLFLLTQESFAQSKKSNDIAPIDSTIYAYYQKCLEHRADSIVLSMSDTLFQMSGEKGDERMQAVALSTKLDHYYFGNHPHKKDSVIEWVNRVKAFAKKTNQPKYYYFVWGNRLIYYYIHGNNYHLALAEADKMLKEAEAEKDLEGIANCYNCISAIFHQKGLQERTLEYRLKGLELFENYEIDGYNISMRYFEAADILTSLGRLDSVPYYMDKGEKYIKTAWHRALYYSYYFNYYLANDNVEEAKKYLELSREVFENNKELHLHLINLYQADFSYYSYIKNYSKALEALDIWKSEMDMRRENSAELEYTRLKAEIFWNTNRKADAAQLYKEYIELLNAEKEKTEEITAAEFATLLDLQKLNAEKQELENLNRKKTFDNIRIITLLLSLLLIIVILFLYHQNKINKQLKKSKEELDQKNQILLKAKEKLSSAKDIAERNSKMKTVFIQNMSHEIRTPLNAIVGFSDVLSGLFGNENEDIKQFAALIEENSQVLLKLIDDILTIAYLDDPVIKLILTPTNINLCCEQSIKQFNKQLSPKVSLQFIPTREELIVMSNAGNILLVLEQLLSNAIKFTEEGNITLTYTYDEKPEELTLTVTDTGRGIPADKHEIVFERFVKLDEFTQGTGLGLSICQIIANRLGGDIVIDSKYTSGCRIHFIIPAQLTSKRGQSE